MSQPVLRPTPYQFRFAQPRDRHPIRRLLRSYDRPSPSLSKRQVWKRYFGLGLLIGAMLHGLLLIGGSALMLYGMAGLAALVFVGWFNLWLFIDWQHYWIVEYQGWAVACGKVVPHKSYVVLCNVVVSPEYRQQGIGSFLVSSIAQKTRLPLYLACMPERLTFYRRLGFVKVEPQSLNSDLRRELGLTLNSKLLPMVQIMETGHAKS